MAIFNSYVKLPEGIPCYTQLLASNVQFIQFIRAALGSHTAWESLAPGWLWERWRLAPGGCDPITPKNPIGWILRMDILNEKQRKPLKMIIGYLWFIKMLIGYLWLLNNQIISFFDFGYL